MYAVVRDKIYNDRDDLKPRLFQTESDLQKFLDSLGSCIISLSKNSTYIISQAELNLCQNEEVFDYLDNVANLYIYTVQLE